jgi:hypothetical protein
LRVESQPPGAEAKSTHGQSCRTPCELNVQPGSDQSVTVALDGYQPQTVPLHSETGAGKIGPNPLFVELKAESPAPPAKKKKKRIAVQKKLETTAAVASPQTTASVPTTAPVAESALTPWPAAR